MAKTLREQKINQIVYISIGGVIAAIILFIVLLNIFSSNKNNSSKDLQIGENIVESAEIEEANSPIGKTVEESKNNDENGNDETVQIQVADETQIQGQLSEEISEEAKSSNDEIMQSVENSNKSVLENSANAEIETNSQTEEIKKDPTFIMPVEGEIMKHYGKDKLIYSDTLKEWTTHLGIDIRADKTTVVKASCDGSVKSIKNDPRYGLTVVVEHENGFTSVYSNLLTAEFVVIGENVKAGQTLGTVGNSATFEILDDAHLHFEILKDGNSVDPEMYIK